MMVMIKQLVVAALLALMSVVFINQHQVHGLQQRMDGGQYRRIKGNDMSNVDDDYYEYRNNKRMAMKKMKMIMAGNNKKKNKSKKRMMHKGGSGDHEPEAAATDAPTPYVPTFTTVPPSPETRVRVPNFFLAYVVASDAREPTNDEYTQIVNISADFFVNAVRGMRFISPALFLKDVELALDSTMFEAGIPDVRFNIYMEYSYADLVFTSTATTPTLPTSEEAFALLRDSIDATYILDHVRSLVAADSPFVTTNEVVFRATP